MRLWVNYCDNFCQASITSPLKSPYQTDPFFFADRVLHKALPKFYKKSRTVVALEIQRRIETNKLLLNHYDQRFKINLKSFFNFVQILYLRSLLPPPVRSLLNRYIKSLNKRAMINLYHPSEYHWNITEGKEHRLAWHL